MTALKVTDLGDFLKEQRQHAKMSLRQLAEQAGVSNPYLSQVERGLRKPSAEVLQQIAKGLRISAEALYVRAGILEERGDRVEVEAAVLADPWLSERQRRVLLDIYQTFRAENERDAAGADEHAAEVIAGAVRATAEPEAKPTRKAAAGTRAAGKRAARKQAAGRQTAGSSTARQATKRAASTTRTRKQAAGSEPAGAPSAVQDKSPQDERNHETS
ncbi:MAG: helix-turn-helix domain-containing protein [Actinomycetes bacterium]